MPRSRWAAIGSGGIGLTNDVEVASPTAIRIHNESGAPRSGNITLTW